MAQGIGGMLCAFFCGLCILLPAAVILTAMNEEKSVCREWAIEGAQNAVVELDCAKNDVAMSGKAIAAGELGFVSCAVNPATYKNFTEIDFDGLAGVKHLFGPAGVGAAAMSMEAKQWQCVEFCAEYTCDRRLEEESSKEDSSVHTNQTSGSEVEGRRLLSRRLKELTTPRFLKSKYKSKSCTNRCIRYSYRRELRADAASNSFHDAGSAAAICGSNYQSSAAPVKLGTSYVHSEAGQIGTLPGNMWRLNDVQVQRLPIETATTVPPTTASTLSSTATGPFASLTNTNTFVAGNTLKTCGGNNMDCLEITFKMATPAHITMLGAVSSTPGLMTAEGWEEPGYWLCKDSSANIIDRSCPAWNTRDVTEMLLHGYEECGEEVQTMELLFTNMKNANSGKQWLLRFIGFVLFFAAFNACFQPIDAILTWITDMMDAGTECIPCVGCCVDCLTDIFMGIVRMILFIVSCFCSCAWFLGIVAMMWIVMRPVMGSIFTVLVICFCCASGGLLKAYGGGGSKIREFDEDMQADPFVDNE